MTAPRHRVRPAAPIMPSPSHPEHTSRATPPRTTVSRREVLKLAGALAGASLASDGGAAGREDAEAQAAPPTGRTQRVIVAGGGIGGLSCAYELMKRGHDVTVLEASGRTGGHVKTIRDPLADGLYADVGAEHFVQLPAYKLYWGYVREFGLQPLYYPHREHLTFFIKGRMYTQVDLSRPTVL